jgi:hypothetical protein
VLLVEDSPDEDAELITITLRRGGFERRHGYNVFDAQNAGDALLSCECYEPKVYVLLTDVVVPR